MLSTEAIQAVQSLKLAQNSPSKLDQVFSTKLSRLLKADLEDALAELQRQNEFNLALKVCCSIVILIYALILALSSMISNFVVAWF